MTVPKINSAHGSDTRNIINRAIEVLNRLGIDVQTLVAEGQLTPTQYAELITVINGHLKSGEVGRNSLDSALRAEVDEIRNKIDKGDVSVYDINKNRGKLDQTYLSEELLQQIAGTADINAVPADGSLTTEKFADKSVSEEKTTFINVSRNMIDENTLESGKMVNSSGGIVDGSYNLSPLIAIKANTLYSFSGVDSLAYYDENGGFVSYSTIYSLNNPIQKRSPFSVAYMRVNVYRPAMGSVIINEGNEIIEYEPYYKRLMNIDIDGEGALKPNSISGDKLINHTLTPEKTSFIDLPDNLINEQDITIGYTINTSNGEPSPNNSVNLTDYIAVTPSTIYSFYSALGVRIAFYGVDKSYISNIYIASDEIKKFTTPPQAFYVRLAIMSNGMDEIQLNAGNELLPYTEYHPPKLSDEISVGNISSGTYNTLTSDFYVDDIVLNEFYTAPDIETQSLAVLPHTEVYGLYDGLMANHSDYISRTHLGNEPSGKPIYRYDFKPKVPRDPDPENIFKKVFIVTGTHGHERVSIWNTFHALEQIADNWENDETLESLRWNVHFIVIPVLNPWGLDYASDDGQISGTRKNSSGVDINRNMPKNWRLISDTDSSTYGGEEPLSEIETQFVYDILEKEKDIILFIDYHNFSTADGNTNYIWHPGTAFTNNIAKSMISKLSRKWKAEHTVFADETEMLGNANAMVKGTLADQAAEFGIHGATYETSIDVYAEPNSPNYSELTFKLGVEALINHIAVQLKNLIPLENNRRIK